MFGFKRHRDEHFGSRVPDGTRVYAIGDIHGRVDLLRALIDRIRAEARDCEVSRRVLVCIGDYVDRGPDSRAVIDYLLSDPAPEFQTVLLLGNHEEWLLRFLDGDPVGHEWLIHGGYETLQSYGVAPDLEAALSDDFVSARQALAQALPPAHLAFLRERPLTHREGDYLFVHAGIHPGVRLDAQDPRALLWIRGAFTRSRADHGCVVVHGHTISAAPANLDNRIGIDTGAFESDVLTCVVLEGDSRRFLQT